MSVPVVGSCWIQMGADSGIGMSITLVDATANGLGLAKGTVDVSSSEGAGDAINRIKDAIETVSAYRNSFGSEQNRLEHGLAINKNTVENTQAAESRIRDLDISDEMMLYSQNNILAQMGQSMLAQTNQQAQELLALLR